MQNDVQTRQLPRRRISGEKRLFARPPVLRTASEYLRLAIPQQGSMPCKRGTLVERIVRSVVAAAEWKDETMALAERPMQGVAQASKPDVPPTSKSAGGWMKLRLQNRRAFAGLETRDTADLEVCATARGAIVRGSLIALALLLTGFGCGARPATASECIHSLAEERI